MRLDHRLLGLSLAFCAAPLLTGCEADQSSLLYVFSTHHATPEDGQFPIRGEDDQPRVFDNDLGWTVTLVESYVTIEAVTLISCSGTTLPLDMFWGPCPEDLRDEDLLALTVAGRKVDPGDYCELVVDYGRYRMPEIEPGADDTRHEVPANEDVEGTSVYLRGAAQMGEDGELIQFELRGTGSQSVSLDLTTVEEGHALRVSESQAFPEVLLISKTYDRFFDGIDFADFDVDDAEDELDDILEDETRIQSGEQVLLPADDR
jgi:hypothetical protein